MACDKIPAVALVIICLLELSCRPTVKEPPPFHIVATDAGFEAPAGLAAGLRHIIYENHGTKIHEAMLVRLATGMTPAITRRQLKKANFFRKARSIIPAPA